MTELNEKTGIAAIAVAIEVFESAPDLDGDLPAHWRERASALSPVTGFRRARLYRALPPESRFAYVAAVEWESVEAREKAMSEFGAPAPEPDAMSLRAVYSVVDELAGTATAAEGGGSGVMMINAFELPADRVDEFLAVAGRRARQASGHPGFRGYRMHRVLGAARFPLVQIAHYASAEQWRALQADPGFQARKAAGPAYATANPALYEVVAEVVASS